MMFRRDKHTAIDLRGASEELMTPGAREHSPSIYRRAMPLKKTRSKSMYIATGGEEYPEAITRLERWTTWRMKG